MPIESRSDQRPDPDALLAKIQREEHKAARGHLKIFFGMAPGVGKTYTMLEAARARAKEGIDVVVGIVETHKRADTASLMHGLECLPLREIMYRGHQLREFDLDSALKRRPALLLVDELAHANVEGSRHIKRWQDVEELLAAGIDVYSTVNVQHLESVNDQVGQITGVRVQETFPDRVYEEADEVELIDLSPDDLLKRLQDGKVYLPEQAERAAQNFFRKGNLIALRELSLKRMADRVDAQMRAYRDSNSVEPIWGLSDHLLVAIGPNALAENMVRAGKRMASAINARWTVVYVQTTQAQTQGKQSQEFALRALQLAASLGAETVTLTGTLISAELMRYAQARNISKLMIGRPHTPAWKRWLFGSAVDAIQRQARNIDVFIIGSNDDDKNGARASSRLLSQSEHFLDEQPLYQLEQHRLRRWKGIAIAFAATLLCAPLAGRVDNANLIMVYLLGVALTAVRYGRSPSVLNAILSVLLFDFFYVAPNLTFAINDSQYLITFGIMLAVALIISRMASNLGIQAHIANMRERRLAELYAMSQRLAEVNDATQIKLLGMRHINAVFKAISVVLTPDMQRKLVDPTELGSPRLYIPNQDMAVAQWVFDHGEAAGRGTATLPSAEALYLPLQSASGVVGVLGLRPKLWDSLQTPEQRHQLETFANQIAQALERIHLAHRAEESRLRNERELLRNSLLASISHDLRTPLATIIGSASTLLHNDAMPAQARMELIDGIQTEAERMNELIIKVLDMAKLESGGLALDKQWLSLEELIGTVLAALKVRLREHQLIVQLPHEQKLVHADPMLLERVISNLLENAAKYSPLNSVIRLMVEYRADNVFVGVIDNGHGLPAGSEDKIFEKFFRLHPENPSTGVGLGLAICRAIVEAHGGRIWAESRASGAEFYFTLPQKEKQPVLDAETNA